MNIPDLQTQRLLLRAITVSALEAELSAPDSLSAVLSLNVDPSWPPEHWEPHVFQLLLNTCDKEPRMSAWHRYIVRTDVHPPTLVGCLGGFRFDDAPDEVEIGYSLLPAHQRLGFATEAVHAYTRWLRVSEGVSQIVANTFPHLLRSIGVLHRCGFRQVGPGREEGSIRFVQTH